jgi:hypothetical protein
MTEWESIYLAIPLYLSHSWLSKRLHSELVPLQSILLHAWDGIFPKLASMIDELGKYLACIILAVSESGFCRILHTCLARSALLNMIRSLKPNPPLSFETPIIAFDQCHSNWGLIPCGSKSFILSHVEYIIFSHVFISFFLYIYIISLKMPSIRMWCKIHILQHPKND